MKHKIFLLLTIALTVISTHISAQTWLEKMGKKVADKATQKVEERIERRSEEAVDKSMDKTEDAIKRNKKEQDETGEQQPDKILKKQGIEDQNQQSLQSYSKYDFVPGEKVIFFTDFSNTSVGDFPTDLNTNGSGEIVTTSRYPGKWLKIPEDRYKSIWTDGLLNLPDNYTIEFDIIPVLGTENRMTGWESRLIEAENAKGYDGGAIPGKAGLLFGAEYTGRPLYRAYENSGDRVDVSGFIDDETKYSKPDHKSHIAIWVQKSRVRVYQDQNKMVDLPRAFPGAKLNRLRFESGDFLVSNIRVAVGAPDTRSKLITEGKLVSYGIYFDVNKDVVKPESYGTLKEIAQVLKENPDVKVKIVGHTDSDGDDAKNMDLSKRRGASVKNELVKTFGIDASRLESDGLGESKPVAANDTPGNKALNRRVEFIKL